MADYTVQYKNESGQLEQIRISESEIPQVGWILIIPNHGRMKVQRVFYRYAPDPWRKTTGCELTVFCIHWNEYFKDDEEMDEE